MAKNFNDEEKILEAIRNGKRQKYKILVDRYAPMVFHIVRQFIQKPDETEELVQQIFVKTYEKLELFNHESKFSSWLYQIARNHCRDYVKNIRRKNKRFSELKTQTLSNKLVEHTSADDLIHANERAGLLGDALDHISHDYATAFLMKYRDNMTYRAMSERLDASVSTLKVRVHRARKELKHFIQSNR